MARVVKNVAENKLRSTELGLGCIALAAMAAAVLLTGCRHRPPKRPEERPPIVKGVSFEGNTRFDRKNLIGHLQIKANSPWSKLGLADTSYLVKGRIREDKQRIVALYRSAGYYDAEVVDVRAEKTRERSKRVKIIFVIEEGEPILLSKVTYAFRSPFPDTQRITRRSVLKEGGPADVADLNRSKERMLSTLKKSGYVFAEIDETMTVDLPNRSATAHFDINPGPRPRIGDITLTGLSGVPEDLVRREIADFEGRRFTPTLKKEMENKLLAMNVFNVASVSPEAKLDDKGRLPVNVLLSESDPQDLKLGLGVGLESNKNFATVNSLYTHRNLLGRLFGFEMRTAVGYAVMPDFAHLEQHGPVLSIQPSLTNKGLLEKDLMWVLKTSFETDVEEEYKYFGPTASLSVSRFFFKKTLASLSYNFESFFIYSATSRWESALAEIYPGLESPFLHGYVEARYRILLTDRLVNPRNGAVLELRYAVSAKALGSDTPYQRINPKLSLYWQIVPRLQLAVRAETGLLFPFGGTDVTLEWSNFSLGGYNTVRGWGGKKLAPSIEFCVEEDDCETVRMGGRTMVLGNVELRLRTIKDLYVVTFLDGGDVQWNVMTYVPSRWNYSVGGGIRYNTPVGKVRFDIGYRLNNPEPYTEEPRWGFHLGLGEAF